MTKNDLANIARALGKSIVRAEQAGNTSQKVLGVVVAIFEICAMLETTMSATEQAEIGYTRATFKDLCWFYASAD